MPGRLNYSFSMVLVHILDIVCNLTDVGSGAHVLCRFIFIDSIDQVNVVQSVVAPTASLSLSLIFSPLVILCRTILSC